MNSKKQNRKSNLFTLIAGLLCICTTFQACKDDYIYDEKEPAWLGASIYSYLQEQGRFSYFLKVIDDLNYTEVLSKTGSKTLFVAGDEAFLAGIKQSWGLDKYEDLSSAQKKIILYNAMLDNAYLLEMMSNTAASNINSDPVEGRCLRQVTSSNIVDSIGLFHDGALPQNNPFWENFREAGIRLATDGTNTMMVHFLEEQLYQNSIKTEDLFYLFNKKYSDIQKSDAFIFDKKVVGSNVTCKNGYVHELDGLLIPPSNMAEMIRQNPKTQLFSRLLDRFSVPVLNNTLTQDFNRIYHNNDDAASEPVYEKRYFTSGSNRGTAGDGFLSYVDENGTTQNAKGSLSYDPGWNYYKAGTAGTSSAENDMAAMFIPNDATLTDYFSSGGGKFLVERYGKGCKTLTEKLDSIPLDVIQALIRNLMKSSFNSTVPSKFESIMNDARDPMGVSTAMLDECMIANNGVVYVMKEVYSPAKYVAVSAPVLIGESLKITNWAINQYEFDKYLLAMDSYFSLVVPADGAMRYYDPATLGSDQPLLYIFKWNEAAKSEGSKVYAEKWTYDPETLDTLVNLGNETGSTVIKNLLTNMLEYYIVVGDFLDGNKYHMSKGYGTIKVDEVKVDANGRKYVTKVYGGKEVQRSVEGKTTVTEAAIGEIYRQENGNTFRLDEGMIQPPTQSVYNVLDKTEEFAEFFNLSKVSDEVINLFGARDEKGNIITDSISRYHIFEAMNGLTDNVRTFNTYHYTIYVPTNEAIQKAYSEGLPRWEDLDVEAEQITELQNTLADNNTLLNGYQEDLRVLLLDSAANAEAIAKMKESIALTSRVVTEQTTEATKRIASLKADATLIINFVKYHIQDNSVYVDELDHFLKEGNEIKKVVDYETAALDNVTKRYSKVTVQSDDSPFATHRTLAISGDVADNSNICHVQNTDGTEGLLFNIMTRDLELNADKSTAKTIETSSFAVVHQIDGVLLNDRIYDTSTQRFIK